MNANFTENHVEEATFSWLEDLGYAVLHGPDISPDGGSPERSSYGDVILFDRLRMALARINPHLPSDALEEVVKKVRQTETPSLVEENRRLHRLIVEGVDVEVAREDGSIGGDKAWLIDFEHPENNDWVALNQFTVIEHKNKRRPDVVIFINGLPLAVVELKNPGNENATIEGAFNQLQTYKDQIPSLFRTNAVLVTSDGTQARVGSLTADSERFMPWRTVDGQEIAQKGAPELGTLLEGVFEKERFLSLIRDFTVFGNVGSGLVKIVAGYHQFHAVHHAVAKTVAASGLDGDRRIGVIWHTQGSGKSLLMAFYAGRIVADPALENPTIVVITDRNDLDDQLFGTFSLCKDLLRQTPQQADSREDLQRMLSRPSGGVIFTTIQKFSPAKGETDYPLLTDRRNVVVIADAVLHGFDRIARPLGLWGGVFIKGILDTLLNISQDSAGLFVAVPIRVL
jgi:type I restriction enzyme R subunit